MPRSLRYIRRAYALLENRTPLKTDCGALCAGSCCKGDENTGMQLLPSEEELLKFADFTIKSANDTQYCICSGHCDRTLRPFSCRIFPYFPIPIRLRSGRYTIRVLPDPRALAVCPLLRSESAEIDPHFLHAVARAGRELLKHPDTREWLLNVAEQIRSIAELQVKLGEK